MGPRSGLAAVALLAAAFAAAGAGATDRRSDALAALLLGLQPAPAADAASADKAMWQGLHDEQPSVTPAQAGVQTGQEGEIG